MRYAPNDPLWINRDRFVLSNGHASALLYSMLHLLGILTTSDLQAFRSLDSVTPGHPEVGETPGVEVTTGPLGQGVSNAVGMAIAGAHMGAVYNKADDPRFASLFDSTVYTLVGDGCLQEGVSAEALSLAGHLKLGNLIALYDDNSITIDGSTDISFSENVQARFEAYGWATFVVENGNDDVQALRDAIAAAKAVADQPCVILVRTEIGFGAGEKAGTHSIHGSPLSEEELGNLKEHFGLPRDEKFYVPDEVAAFYADVAARGNAAAAAWQINFDAYVEAYPEEGAELARRLSGELPEGWREALPSFSPEDKSEATRSLSGKVLNALAPLLPELVGGSADLTPSNKTALKCTHDFQAGSYDGRYLRFGVREHGMTAICNGIFAFGAGFRPFGATFLNFLEYAAGAFRLSALSHFGVLFIMTHDSIGLGEDGPTHQPTTTPTYVRSMANALFIRPADGNEVAGAYAVALERNTMPTVLSLARQSGPHLAGSSTDSVARGAYSLASFGPESDSPDLILTASGTEVGLVVEAAQALADADGLSVSVVSFPCWSLFEEQDQAYRESVFPPFVPVLAVEPYASTGWSKFSHAQIALDNKFGKSAPASDIYAHFGFTVDNVASRGKALVQYYQDAGYQAEPLMKRW